MGNSRALEILLVVSILALAVVFQFISSPFSEKTAQVSTTPKETTQTTSSETTSITPTSQKPTHTDPVPKLSILGSLPNWAELNNYQRSITREQFLTEIENVYSVSNKWEQLFKVREDRVEIIKKSSKLDDTFCLFFKTKNDIPKKTKRYWKSATELNSTSKNTPLKGMTIAIDPGHIGGDFWAPVEERDFFLKGDEPVREGELTLKVARMLKPKLEKLGAVVILVRDSINPVNPKTPENYLPLASKILKKQGTIPSSTALKKLSEKLFYRTGEIRERAKLVNQSIQPDLLICLHFNATFWGDEENRKLAEHSHFHIILHGAYTDNEIMLDDERFSLIKKILTNNHQEEKEIATTLAKSMVEHSGLPPFTYEPNSKRAININKNPYLWARNLLANRLYQCPVIYMEPYVMNSRIDYQRIQLGDYDGKKTIHGKSYPSIYREYVDAIADGLKKHYSNKRK